jgi:4-diphosphocytidyl-2-C-methyl-D-erythritol kinase
MITEPAPAKLNLALHVRARRPDGYHELETIFAFCRDGDVITIEAGEPSFVVVGPFAAALAGEGDNLVLRAERAFCDAFGVEPAHAIALEKNLPVASGLGGGSADAAATLRALARLHDVTDDPRLPDIAARLGSDVPACLDGRTTIGRGRGERLTVVDGAPGTPVLLVNPGVAVATGPVFAGWDRVDRGPLGTGALLDVAHAGRNDLQPPAVAIAPVIAELLDLLRAQGGATLVRMSGSGATCFALFDRESDRATAALAAGARGWWCLETALA